MYHITFNRFTDDSILRQILDGKVLSDNKVLALEYDGKEHFVEMWIK